MIKSILNIILLSLLGAANLVWADPADFTDRAEVISALPIYQEVNTPQQQCWTETVSDNNANVSDQHHYGGALLGGVVGGLLGNTVGQGNGRIAAAAVGAVTGAVVGDRMDNSTGNNNNQPQQVQHCANRDNFHQVLSGYNVNYRYRGRTMTAVMPQDPGKYVLLNVHVGLAGNQPGAGSGYPEGGPGNGQRQGNEQMPGNNQMQ